jgi:aromatic-L-amino-acid decarboxylase
MENDDFRKHAHQFVDWMADYMDGVEDLPVRSQVKPGEIMEKLPFKPPVNSESMENIFEDFKKTILPGMTHWQHPNWFGFFPANVSGPSILAEMLVTTMGAQCMIWETSPAATELEIRVLDWLRQMIGLPEGFQGVIQDTASSATFCAVIAAREKALKGKGNERGLAAEKKALVIYASEEAHSSIEKAVLMAGLGRDNLRKIPILDDFSLSVDHLRLAIKEDRAAGRVPAGLIACLGTTSVGAVDPVVEMGKIALEENLYFHVDAAWAGSALILPEYQHLIGTCKGVDSFVFNPHKWLLTNFDCTAHFVKNEEDLTSALSILPEYLRTREGKDVRDYRDWGIQLGRRFRSLKLWFVLRSFGVEKLQGFIRKHISWANKLSKLVESQENFELVTKPNFSLFTFRWMPITKINQNMLPPKDKAKDDEVAIAEVLGETLDKVNDQLLQAINDDGRIYLTRTVVAGRVAIRFSVGSQNTTEAHVMAAWDTIKEIANNLEIGE